MNPPPSTSPSCIVLGGGIGGLTLADLLSEKGIHVTLIEKDSHLGGLCRPVYVDGGRVDLGPHVMRTRDERVLAYWKLLLGSDLQENRFWAQLYFVKKLIQYPIKVFELIFALPKTTLLQCTWDLFCVKLKGYWGHSKMNSFEDWVVANYGRGLYRLFFAPLTEKVWGVPPETLDIDFARERVPPLSLRRSLFNIKPKGDFHSEDPKYTQQRYPKNGVYQICEKIISRLESRGVKILTDVQVTSISEHQTPDKVYLETSRGVLQADYLASSIPIPALTRVHQQLQGIDLGSLSYRGIGFIFLSLPRSVRLPSSFIYCADPEAPFNRLTDYSRCSEAILPPEKNIIGVEFNTRSKNASELQNEGEKIIEYLKKTGLFDLSVLHHAHYAHAPVVYPVYLRDYKKHLMGFFHSALQCKKLLCFGRQGLFAYSNIDHVMVSAFDASDLLIRDLLKSPDTPAPSTEEKKTYYFSNKKLTEREP